MRPGSRAAVLSLGAALLGLALWGAPVARAVPAGSAPPREERQPADYLFQNGKVYTMNPARPWAEAVAVKGKRLVFVGANRDGKAFVGDGTRVVDLGGRMLMPGFVDGHNHCVTGAMGKRGVDLGPARNKQEMLALLRDYVRAHPEKPAYLGFNWTFITFAGDDGTRHDLDAVCKDKPVVLFNEDNHDTWFNTRTMEMAGLTKDSKDPVPGLSYYRREPDGTPNGIAIEPDTAMALAIASGVVGGKDSVEEAMGMVFPLLAPSGITAYHDMGMWAPSLTDGYLGFEVLQEREREGKLPCRVVGVYALRDSGAPVEEGIGLLKRWSQTYRSELVQVTGLKIWCDGTFLSHTGIQLEPYHDRPDLTAESGWTVDRLATWTRAAQAGGFDVFVHVDGDGAVRRCLDAFALARRDETARGRRYGLEHTNTIHPDDLPRFKALGVMANLTPVWCVDYKGQYEAAIRIHGAEKVSREYNIQRSLLPEGVNLSFGSDIPGTEVQEVAPLYQIQAMVDGRVPGSRTEIVPPRERLFTLEEALRGYTWGGAWQLHMEDRIGSLEEGKLADLIVLEKNLFEVPSRSLSSVKVQLTMMNGRITHEEKGSNLVTPP